MDEKEITGLTRDVEALYKEVKSLKEQLRELKKIGDTFRERYEEMLGKEEEFLGQINEEIEREITVVVLGNIKKTIDRETAALKILRRNLRSQVRRQIGREIDKLRPHIRDLVSQEVKPISVEVMNQLKRQTGRELEKEVIEQVKEATESLIEQKEAVEQKAIVDELTGAFNRRFFETKLEDELTLAKRFKDRLSLIMFDIDHFKKVNDTYGHQAGDAVLSEVSATIKSKLSGTDTLCRYGGEEFAVIMPGTPVERALEVAERLRKAIEEHTFYSDEKLISVTISLGVSEYPAHAIIKQLLIETADAALYSAKHSGRNRVVQAEKQDNKT